MLKPKVILAGPTHCHKRRAGRVNQTLAQLKAGYEEARSRINPDGLNIAHAPFTLAERIGVLAAIAFIVATLAHSLT
jgi:hypothetical protein